MMQELYPSLTAPKDGSVPRAEVTVSTSAALQPWLKSKAWSEPPAPGTTGDISAGEWDPVQGVDPGKCRTMGSLQTQAMPCVTSAVCVHVLIANTAPHAAPAAVHVSLQQNGTTMLDKQMVATLPFEGYESYEIIPVNSGVFADTLPAFSIRIYRIGCGAPPLTVGNVVLNPSFEDITTTGAVASWGMFTQHEQRDRRCMLFSDTMYSHSGSHGRCGHFDSPDYIVHG
jgi:hypothetical protein